MLDQTPLHLDREGIKEGKGSERGCEAIIIFEGGNYFKNFRLEGGGGDNYLREMMSRGTAIFRGNMVPLLALT